tara:strand:+ start:380 stop:577 length:198 start_codon:yes stop_codon:yes gene_type:complete
MSEELICVICNEPIPIEPNGWKGGRNAEPIKAGRCCRSCDNLVVIPTRIKILFDNQKGDNNEQKP